jgi:hypothetical protein
VIDQELLELLESQVTVKPLSGRGLDGKQTHGTAVSYRCHVERKQRVVVNARGQEVPSSGRCLLDDAYPAITESSLLTLPDGSTPPIVAVETTYDSAGPYQTVVYF